MLFGMAAASSALDLIKTLTQSGSSSSSKPTSSAKFATASGGSSSSATGFAGASGQTSLISPDTLNALLAAQSQSDTTASSATSRSDALKDLFKTLDGDGDGKISKFEFESALGAGGTNTTNADSVFGKLDTDGDGSVSLGELASALKGKHRAHGPKPPNENGDPRLQALNSDATNADGSAVTATSSAASAGATRTYNAIEQMIQRQADMLTSTAASSLSVNV